MQATDPSGSAEPPLLDVTGLRKSFGGSVALSDGRFRLSRGSIHALCGGNGAGKSTFLSILMGIQRRDAGTVRLRGGEVDFANPAAALAAGISIIEQELSPVPGMTIAENIFLGREPASFLGGVNFRSMNRQSATLLDGLGFAIPPDTPMTELSLAQVQLVEIAKALSRDAEILIMDEPTSALGEAEAEHLFSVMRALKARGKGVVYVSHRLTEVFGVADSFTVFRDGAFVADGAMEDIGRGDLIRMIVGRDLKEEYVKTSVPGTDVALRIEALDRPGRLRGIDLELRRGEILGLYGLMGAGRTELLECLFGLHTGWSGTVTLDGTPIHPASVREAMDAGLALVTEDRKGSGLIMSADVRTNASLAILPSLCGRLSILDGARERASVAGVIDRYRIRTASDTLGVADLSGGNQQKVVMGKWALTEPRILLLDEPTRGVDVGAKREIYALMSEFASAGGSILMASSEVEEVLGMCDRIVVVRDGHVAGTVAGDGADQGSLLHLAA